MPYYVDYEDAPSRCSSCGNRMHHIGFTVGTGATIRYSGTYCPKCDAERLALLGVKPRPDNGRPRDSAAHLFWLAVVVLLVWLLSRPWHNDSRATPQPIRTATRTADSSGYEELSSLEMLPDPTDVRVTPPWFFEDPSRRPRTLLLPSPRPAAPAAVCRCDYNAYNCADFRYHDAAQACYRYCVSAGAGDVHWLDADDDGIACELLP